VRSSGSSHPGNHSGPHFKKGGKSKFICSVHEALLDNAEDFNDDFLANMADSTLTLEGNDAEPSTSPVDPSVDASTSFDEAAIDDSAAK
jgi:hypothetical protein